MTSNPDGMWVTESVPELSGRVSSSKVGIRERLWLTILAFAFYIVGYFSLNRWFPSTESHTVATAIDTSLPLMPSWVYVYVFVYFVAFLPMAVVANQRLFQRGVIAYLAAQFTCFVVFYTYPVEMALRQEPDAADTFAQWGLLVVHWIDGPGTCLPSLHVTAATMGALLCWKADRLTSILALMAAALIGISTLLVKQHYIVDVVLGFAVAFFWYRLLVYPVDLNGIPTEELRLPRWCSLLLLAFYGCVLAGVYIAYLNQWEPWLN